MDEIFAKIRQAIRMAGEAENLELAFLLLKIQVDLEKAMRNPEALMAEAQTYVAAQKELTDWIKAVGIPHLKELNRLRQLG
jgi:hypothetical protein